MRKKKVKAIDIFLKADSLAEIKSSLRREVDAIERVLPYHKNQAKLFLDFVEDDKYKIKKIRKILEELEKP